MDGKAKVRMLVQQVVEAYFNEQKYENKKQSIGILLGYQSLHPTAVLEAVTDLLESYEVTFLLSSEWVPFPLDRSGKSYVLMEETGPLELRAIVENTSLLVVPVASYRLLSKLALTMDDELAVWMAIQYQLEGKPIVIANDDIVLTVNQQIQAPHSVQARLQTYLRQIQADQVQWVPLSKLLKTVEVQLKTHEEKNALILAKHIETAHQEGRKEIRVPKRSQITPAAKDLAKELQIKITKESSKGG
ncbi:MAG TPA: hypothetical protein VGI04_05275 [Neobacillus sp.]